MTDQDRIGLFRTTTAYSGTYKFDGKTVEHSIDISWNEYWAGTKQVRTVERDSDRITLTTSPFPFHTDGRISVNSAGLGASKISARPHRATALLARADEVIE